MKLSIPTTMSGKRSGAFTLLLVSICWLSCFESQAQIMMNPGGSYSENFNSLITSGSATWINNLTLAGWYHARSGTGTTIVADNGGFNGGNLNSYGTGTTTERALGSLGSGSSNSGNFYWGLKLQNATGATINSITVTYTGEQWRNSAAAAQTVDFSLLIGSPNVSGSLGEFQAAGTLISVLSFTSPITLGSAGPLNGDLAANRTVRTATITGLSIPNGTQIMLRWADPDHSGADHGMAIDDFSVTWTTAPPPVTLSASLRDALTNDVNSNNVVNPGDQVTYTNTIRNTGVAEATGVNLMDTVPVNTTLVGKETSALARDDQYTAFFNTTFNTGNVLTNDFGLPSLGVVSYGTTASLGVTTPVDGTGATDAGGTFLINASGQLVYNPPFNFSGTDKFIYIATTGASGLPNNNAVVTVTVNPDINFGVTTQNISCNGLGNGSITFSTPTGGSGSGYTYSINGASGTFTATTNYIGLSAGSYTPAVKDGAGYTKELLPVDITEPAVLSFTTTDVHNTCNGGTAGSITFNPTGGTPNYLYSITGAAGTYVNTPAFTGLAAGTYQLAVKDNNACIATSSVTITQPAAINITNVTYTDVTCHGLNNGTITFDANGGAGTLSYSVTGPGGPFQATGNFSGLAPGSYTLAVKDGNNCVATSGPVMISEPAVITVNGTIPQLTYNVPMTPVTFTKTGGTGSPANPWSATGLTAAGLSINTASGQVSGTPNATGSFPVTVTYTDGNGCTGSSMFNILVGPNVQNQSYTGVGNTQLGTASYTPSTPAVIVTKVSTGAQSENPANIVYSVQSGPTNGNLSFSNDGSFLYTPSTPGTTTPDQFTFNGTVNGVSTQRTASITFNGIVWYVDNATGSAVNDGRSNTPFKTMDVVEASAGSGEYIYVHTGSGNTTGNIILEPSQTLRGAGSALTVGALSIPAGSSPTLSGGITLANNITADGFNMNTAATTPITGNTVSGVSLNLGSVNMSGAANALKLTSVTGSTFTIASGTWTGGAGSVIDMSNSAFTTMTIGASISQFTSGQKSISITGQNSGTTNINATVISGGLAQGISLLNNTGGTINFAGSIQLSTAGNPAFTATGGGTIHATSTLSVISTTTGTGLDLQGITVDAAGFKVLNINSSNGGKLANLVNIGGTGTKSLGRFVMSVAGTNPVTFTSAGTVEIGSTSSNSPSTIRSSSGAGITISGTTLNITGQATSLMNVVATGSSMGLSQTTSGTTSITGGFLNITSATGTGFNAAAGTISLTGTNNVISASGGIALNVVNATIGVDDLNFQSISASGGPNGIVLNNTGTSGGLIVNGDGTTTSKGGNASGGTITNMTGADGSTSGIGIYLNTTRDVILRRMNINGTIQNMGIHGLSVTNFTLQYSTISGTIGTTSGTNDLNLEAPIVFGKSAPGSTDGLFGTGLIDSCIIRDGIQHNLQFYNQSGTLNLTISKSDIRSNGAALGSDGLQVETIASANSTISVQNCTFDDNKSQAIQLSALGSSIVDFTVNACNIKRTIQGNEGPLFQNGGSAKLTLHFTNNIVSGYMGNLFSAGTVVNQGTSAANVTAVIKDNIFTQASPVANRAVVFFPSSINAPGNIPTSNVLFDNNTITSSTDAEAFFISTPDPLVSPSYTATVINNDVIMTSNTGNALRGMTIQATQGSTSNGAAACLDVRNNTVTYTNGNPPGIAGLRIRQANPGGGAVNPTVNLEEGISAGTPAAVLAANNPGATTEVVGTVTVVGNNTCSVAPTRANLTGKTAKN